MDQIENIILATLRGYHAEVNRRFDNETACACLLDQAETLCQGHGLSMATAFDLACKVNPLVGEYR